MIDQEIELRPVGVGGFVDGILRTIVYNPDVRRARKLFYQNGWPSMQAQQLVRLDDAESHCREQAALSATRALSEAVRIAEKNGDQKTADQIRDFAERFV